MAAWMRMLAWLNPVTYAVDGMRSLILSGWNGPSLLRMVMVLVIFDILMFLLGSRVLRRHMA